jgi:hypothetical protein
LLLGSVVLQATPAARDEAADNDVKELFLQMNDQA